MKKNGMGIVLAVVCMTLLAIESHAASVTVSVATVRQSKSKWCWAACAEMFGRAEYPSANRNQYTLVAMIKGSTLPNEGANAYETASACSLMTNGTKVFNVYGSSFSTNRITSNINNGHPVIAITGPISALSDNELHDVLIYGYDVSGVYHVELIDPADGLRKKRTYNSLISGVWCDSGIYPYSATISLD